MHLFYFLEKLFLNLIVYDLISIYNIINKNRKSQNVWTNFSAGIQNHRLCDWIDIKEKERNLIKSALYEVESHIVDWECICIVCCNGIITVLTSKEESHPHVSFITGLSIKYVKFSYQYMYFLTIAIDYISKVNSFKLK